MVEVLVASYGSTERTGRGQAMQAIQLLASTHERFDDAVDLFFDLVERSCMQQRSQTLALSKARPRSDVMANQTIHTFDETLVKLISKQWSLKGPKDKLDVIRPLQRINALRKDFALREIQRARQIPGCRATSFASTVFFESQSMLLSISKKRYGEVLLPKVQNYRWIREWKTWATPPCVRSALLNREARASMIVPETPVRSAPQRKVPQMEEAVRTISKKDAEILDLKRQIQMLYDDTKSPSMIEGKR